MRSLFVPVLVLHASTHVAGGSLDYLTDADAADPEIDFRRRRLIDIDGDGNEDEYYATSARTNTPKSTEYQAYFHDVIDAYGCGRGYYGYGCEKRLCPYGTSWVVDPFMASSPSDDIYTPWGSSDDDGMHSYQECSGKGVCDRSSGKCGCFDGYHGKGCRYKKCANDCGTHGVCQPAYVINPEYTGTLTHSTQVWDTKRSFRCQCDYGYTGIDCSDRICPEGLDPVNPFDCEGDGEYFGFDQQVIKFPDALPEDQWFFLEFETFLGGKPFTTQPIHYSTTHLQALVGDIQMALESLPNNAVPSCQVSLLDNDAGYAATVRVAFTDDTTPGRQSLMSCYAPSSIEQCESGAKPMIESANAAAIDCEVGYYNDVSEIHTAYECSSRGECDSSNGKCTCHSGFEGQRCETMFTFY